MAERIQVILSREEKARFHQRAHQRGLSLSAWVREAALAQADAQEERHALVDASALQAFFERCDKYETEGAEPEWEEHARVIERSRRTGATQT